MAQYTLLDPVTGHRWIRPEAELTRNLRLNCILLRENEHLGIITQRDLVAFVRWCASEMLTRLVDEPGQSATYALAMVDRWLEDQQNVTPEELGDAADAAIRAAWVHFYDNETSHEAAARVAARAAEAAWAATMSVDAANDAAHAVVRTRTAPYEAQAQWFVEHLKSGK